MSKLIAVVDDEEDILKLVSISLEKNGFRVRGFADGKKFWSFLKKNRPDLIILDLMLPDQDGLEICKKLKKEEYARIPIIMLTARAEESDKILGLELGADDYVGKPFSPKELVARVKAVLRREEPLAKGESPGQTKIGGILTIDGNKLEVRAGDKKLNLTSSEFKILQLLSSRPGWVYSRERILDHLWGEEKAVLDRTVDVHIKNLREKMGRDGRIIKNIRGFGYKLEV